MMPCTRLTSKSTGRAGASFTSSSLTPQTTSEQIAVDEEEVMFEFMSQAQARQTKKALVRLQTNFGDLLLELYANKAPRTCYNFLMLCRQGKYNNTIFHRNIPGFMIQGGGFGEGLNQKPTKAPIKNEADNGLHNVRGTVAMARTQNVNSATSQFFINHVNNDRLNHSASDFGYAVFGKVVRGMEVVDQIAQVPTGNRAMMQNVPLTPVKIITAKKL